MFVVIASFFVAPFIMEQNRKADIEKAQMKAREEEYRARRKFADEREREYSKKIASIVESSYKPITLGKDLLFVPLNLSGLPSKNLEAISVVMKYVEDHYDYRTIFQIEYTDAETIGIWFKSNTVHVKN